MRIFLIASLTAVVAACSPDGPAENSCKINGVTIFAENPSDCKCLYQFAVDAQNYNLSIGTQKNHLPLEGLTIYFQASERVQNEFLPPEGLNRYFGLYYPGYDEVYVSHGAGALAHELLHRYNTIVRGISAESEAAHSLWNDSNKLWWVKEAGFFLKVPNATSCEVPDVTGRTEF